MKPKRFAYLSDEQSIPLNHLQKKHSMRLHILYKIAMLTILATIPFMLPAQIQTKQVSFPTGKSSTSVSGTVKGDTTVDYLISVKTGQALSVSLSSKSTSLYFNILPPGSKDEAIFIGSTDGNKFARTLATSGDYKIRVYLYRSAARRKETAKYNLTIGLEDHPK